MLQSVKNKQQRSALVSLLKFIVESTQSTAGFAFVPADDAEKLHKAEPHYIVLDKTVKNAEGQIKATATEAAIQAVASGATETVAASASAPTEATTYEIVTLDKLPEIMRGGAKTDAYPFRDLKPFPQPGNAFFVPATEAKPNPAKSLASTVASATKREAGKSGAVYTVRKAVDANGKVTGAHVIRTK